MARPDKRSQATADRPDRRIVAVSPDDGSAIDLRNPLVAAVLAWLVPGLGHLYQRRWFKGWLVMGMILGLFVAGFALGGGRVVYWSWKPGANRWAMLGQAGIGSAAVTAFIQARQLAGPARAPLLGSLMAPPVGPGEEVAGWYARAMIAREPAITPEDFQTRQHIPLSRFEADELSIWQRRLGRWFEIGTLYTVIAGMLNMLIVYDAWAGPLGMPTDDERRRAREGQGRNRRRGDGASGEVESSTKSSGG